MPTKKGPVGPRIEVSWGTITKKVKGKKTTIKLTSRVLQSTATLFGLKAAAGNVSGATTKQIKTKTGNRLIISGGVSRVSTKKMYASVDGKTWHQLPVPDGLSLAKAFAIFKGGKKAYEIKFHGGTPQVIGKPTKDTKSKAKTATTPTKTK